MCFTLRLTLCLIAGVTLPGWSQSFYNPKIYKVDKERGILFKILKVSHDSAYLYYYSQANKIKLIDLPSGKSLAEVNFPHSPFTFDYNNITYFPTDQGINVINFDKTTEGVLFKLQYLTPDLKLVETGKQLTLKLEKDFILPHIEVREHGDFYEIVFRNGCLRGSGKLKQHYFRLLTVDKNMKVIDDYTYDGKNDSHIASFLPKKEYSNGIAYQLAIHFNDPEKMKQEIVLVGNSGKLTVVRTNRLNNHFNFIPIQDSAGKAYGYCFRLLPSGKDKQTLYMDKYVLDPASGIITIVASGLLVKQCSTDNISEVCTKSIIENNRVKLLTYLIDWEVAYNSWTRPYYAIMSDATYFEFNSDSLVFKYHLPFHMGQGRVFHWKGMDVFMGSGAGKTFVAYIDNPETADPISEEYFDKIPIVNGDRSDFGPVFYKMTDGGGANKNPLRNTLEDEFYKGIMISNNGCKSTNGDFYFPFWTTEPKREFYIVKLSGQEL